MRRLDGEKSTTPPTRVRFMLERTTRSAYQAETTLGDLFPIESRARLSPFPGLAGIPSAAVCEYIPSEACTKRYMAALTY